MERRQQSGGRAVVSAWRRAVATGTHEPAAPLLSLSAVTADFAQSRRGPGTGMDHRTPGLLWGRGERSKTRGPTWPFCPFLPSPLSSSWLGL